MSKHYYYLFEKIPVVLVETGSLSFQREFESVLNIVERNTKVSQYSHVDGIYIGDFEFMEDDLLSVKDRAVYLNKRLFDDTTAEKLIQVISEITLKELPSGLMKDDIWGEIE